MIKLLIIMAPRCLVRHGAPFVCSVSVQSGGGITGVEVGHGMGGGGVQGGEGGRESC